MTAKDLCQKIRSIYPELGDCGGNVEVAYDEAKSSWTVDLTRGDVKLSTYLEPEDVTTCVEGERCVPLAVQVQQLVDNVQRL